MLYSNCRKKKGDLIPSKAKGGRKWLYAKWFN